MSADFGMARRVEASESLTGSAVIGTPAYMAPEQVQGGPVDAHCDQYALGVILFQLATGTLPYSAETPMGYLLKHLNEPFPAASKRNPQVPVMIENVILKATAKDPGERFESVAEMNRILQASLAFIQDPTSNEAPTIVLPITGHDTKVAVQARRSRKTLRIAAAVAAILFFVLAIPVFASGLIDLLEQASSPAEGGLNGPMIELTSQVATIEALSTELSSSSLASAEEIALAVVQTLTVEGFGAPDGEPVDGASLDALLEAASLSRVSLPLSQTSTSPEPSIPTSIASTESPGLFPTTPAPGLTATSLSTPVPSVVPSHTSTSNSPTQTPTHTPPPVPTATEDACSFISLSGFAVDGKAASWSVTNSGSGTVTISRIVLDWPSENGALDRIRFKNSSIWNGNDESPPSDIASSWTGNRELQGGESKDVKFVFTSAAQGSGYDMDLFLSGGCHRSSGG